MSISDYNNGKSGQGVPKLSNSDWQRGDLERQRLEREKYQSYFKQGTLGNPANDVSSFDAQGLGKIIWYLLNLGVLALLGIYVYDYLIIYHPQIFVPFVEYASLGNVISHDVFKSILLLIIAVIGLLYRHLLFILNIIIIIGIIITIIATIGL